MNLNAEPVERCIIWFRMDERTELATVDPQSGDRVLIFKELAHPEGGPPRTIAVTNVQVKPRGYEELASATLHRPVKIPLEVFNGRIVDTDIDGIDTRQYAHFSTTLESPFTSKAIALVRGGWLPSALASMRSNAVILPDRNIISELAGRFQKGRKVGLQADFLDLFADEPIRINPLLAALEGNGRALPEPAAAQAQLEEAVAKVRSALPSATIMVGPKSIDGLLGLIEDSREGMVRKQALLCRLAPALAAPVARRNTDSRWNEAMTAADDLRVPRDSILMAAVLSAIVNPSGHCAAKRLLKFRAGYSEAHAYNALSDLRSLEILMYCFAYFPDYDTQLCTADRSLALFWVGLGASDIEREGCGIRFTMSPHEAVLPATYVERWVAESMQ